MRMYPQFRFEFLNEESKLKYQGVKQRILRSPSNVEEVSEMSTERIEECLNGIEEAVEEEVQSHGIGRENISYNRVPEKQRSIEISLPDAEISVTALITEAPKGEFELPKRKALSENASTEVKTDRRERVPNAGITTKFKLESDSEEYKGLYRDISDRLSQLTQELNLSEGQFFGQDPPNYKSVMS